MLLEKERVATGVRIVCPRCKSLLRKSVENSPEKAFAISLAGLIVFVPAMFMPIMTFSMVGLHGSSNMFDAVWVLFAGGYFFVGIMVLLVSIIFPFLKLSFLFISSLSVFSARISPAGIKTLRWYKHLSEWGMVEVYLLGILVSIIKMYGMAEISYNAGFFCFVGLVLLTIVSSTVTDEEYFWDRIEAQIAKKKESKPSATTTLVANGTAREAGLIRCEECGKISRGVHIADDELMRCRRCLGRLHFRKPDSVGRTWAFLLTACVLFLPANILPIMRVGFMGTFEESTILDGIIYFFQDGDYFIGGIILIASVLVPLFKIVGLFIILFSIHFQQSNWLQQKTKMFRFIEF
ncbi:MAG: paraquat-inducible protein A, partial [Thermodesulfobacteriota bacterium]